MLRIKVIKALYAHMKSDADSLMASEKMLVTSIDKTYDLYFLMLSLVAEMAHYAEQRQEAAKKKQLPTYEDLNPNRKFVDNAVIRLIAQSDSVNDYLAARKLSWAKYPELVKTLFTQLEQSDYYKKYMASQERSFREDLALVTEFYTRELEESEILENVLDEMSILWNDDLGFLLTMVSRTILSMREAHEAIKLMPQFKSEEDLDYAKSLLRNAIAGFERISLLLDNSMQNWDIERVALMDQIILITAIAEAENFPSIPVRVTMNEYIDIAKCYSTDSSGGFINGLLDRIIARLTEEGKIVKSGKGLL